MWRFQLDSIAPSFSSKAFSFSLALSLSLEDPSATGASEAQERSLGKEEQRAVHLQPSPLRTSSAPSPPVLPSLGPLAHWPVPQIKTSDKKIGSLKKRGREEKKGEKEGSPLQAKRSRATKPLLLDGRASLSLCEELSPCQLGPLVVRKTNYNEDTRTPNMHTQALEKVLLIDTFHRKNVFIVTCEAPKAGSKPEKAPNREILKSL